MNPTVEHNQELVLVTGGTGHLGRDLVNALLRDGRRVRVLARVPGTDRRVQWSRGDLSTGVGLREALAGVSSVIHAATLSPIAQRGHVRLIDLVRTPRAVDVDGTRRLLDECARARVAHFVHVSIVGLNAQNALPYNRVKLAGERLVRQSDLPWSIVRAAPFYYLLARLFRSMRWMPWWFLPDAPTQPVDTTDVAQYLAACVGDGQRGVREEIGGPEVASLVEFAQQYLDARGAQRKVIGIDVSAARAVRMGLAPADGRRGTVRWRDWLLTHRDEPGGRVRVRPQPANPSGG